MRHRSRVEKLELEAKGPQKRVVCLLRDENYKPLEGEAAAAKIKLAQDLAGPDGELVVVRYVHDWRSPGGEPWRDW